MAPALMSSSITPKPEPNSARKSRPRAVRSDAEASGTSRSGSGKTMQPSARHGPSPIAREMRPATAEPTRPPTAPAPSTSPSAPAPMPSVRVA